MSIDVVGVCMCVYMCEGVRLILQELACEGRKCMRGNVYENGLAGCVSECVCFRYVCV